MSNEIFSLIIQDCDSSKYENEVVEGIYHSKGNNPHDH
jgi:hypothetical protein